MGGDVRDLFTNGPWLVLFFFGILYVTFTTLKYGTLMFYFKYYVGHEGLATAFMITGLIASMIGAGATKTLTGWWGKRRTVDVLMIAGLVVSVLFYFCRPSDLVPIFVLWTLAELVAAPVVALFFAMLADTADYSEWRSGRRATGLVFSAGTVAMKFGSGIAGAATGVILAAFNYVPNQVQSPDALLGIRLLMSLFPAVVALAIILLMRLYRLDTALLTRIEADLTAQRGTAPVEA
jgi:GPH family glycoside/pentoside/hexuronide:cation symporter